MSGPCLCGDPYCPRCGSSEAQWCESVAEVLAGAYEVSGMTDEEPCHTCRVCPGTKGDHAEGCWVSGAEVWIRQG